MQYKQDMSLVGVQSKSGDSTIKTLIEKVRKGHGGNLRNLYIYIEDNFPNINTKIRKKVLSFKLRTFFLIF